MVKAVHSGSLQPELSANLTLPGYGSGLPVTRTDWWGAPAGQLQQRRTLDSRDTYLLTKFLGKRHHTNTIQLAELASKAKPRLLIIYHGSIVLRPGLRPQASSPEELLKEVLSGYSGEVVVARDLDVY